MLTSIRTVLKSLSGGARSLGVEMTDTHAKWIEVTRAGSNQFQVLTADAEPFAPGAIEEGKIVQPTAVIRSLQTLAERGRFRSKKAHLMLPSSLTMVRFLKLPDVPSKDLKRMIDFELKFNLPLPFDKPFYDFIKLPEPKKSSEDSTSLLTENDSWEAPSDQWNLGTQEAAVSTEDPNTEKLSEKQCEVMIVAASQETIGEYVEMVRAVGLKPISIEIKALSLYRLVQRLRPLDLKSTFVMLDITQAYADVSIYRDGALRLTRNIPVRFPASAATQSGDWPDFDLQNTCQSLFSELDRFINFYRYSLNHRDQEMNGLLVSSELLSMPFIVQYLKERLPFEVMPLETDLWVQDMMPATIQSNGFAAPLGLALRGLNM